MGGMSPIPRPVDEHYPRRREDIEHEIAGYCGHAVNPADSTQVRALLFDELQLPATMAFAVDTETLQSHAHEHPSPLTELVLEWRLASTLGR